MSDAVLSGCRAWIETAMPGFEEVIYSKPSNAASPRPAMPYAAISLLSSVPTGGPYHLTTDTVQGEYVKHRIAKTFRGTLRVDIYGDDANSLARDLELAIQTPEAADKLKDAQDGSEDLQIALIQTVSITDTTGLRSIKWEESSQVEMWIAWKEVKEITVDYIDTVAIEGEGDLEGVDFEVSMTP